MILGTLNIYSSEPDLFAKEEMELLAKDLEVIDGKQEGRSPK